MPPELTSWLISAAKRADRGGIGHDDSSSLVVACQMTLLPTSCFRMRQRRIQTLPPPTRISAPYTKAGSKMKRPGDQRSFSFRRSYFFPQKMALLQLRAYAVNDTIFAEMFWKLLSRSTGSLQRHTRIWEWHCRSLFHCARDIRTS